MRTWTGMRTVNHVTCMKIGYLYLKWGEINYYLEILYISEMNCEVPVEGYNQIIISCDTSPLGLHHLLIRASIISLQYVAQYERVLAYIYAERCSKEWMCKWMTVAAAFVGAQCGQGGAHRDGWHVHVVAGGLSRLFHSFSTWCAFWRTQRIGHTSRQVLFWRSLLHTFYIACNIY